MHAHSWKCAREHHWWHIFVAIELPRVATAVVSQDKAEVRPGFNFLPQPFSHTYTYNNFHHPKIPSKTNSLPTSPLFPSFKIHHFTSPFSSPTTKTTHSLPPPPPPQNLSSLKPTPQIFLAAPLRAGASGAALRARPPADTSGVRLRRGPPGPASGQRLRRAPPARPPEALTRIATFARDSARALFAARLLAQSSPRRLPAPSTPTHGSHPAYPPPWRAVGHHIWQRRLRAALLRSGCETGGLDHQDATATRLPHRLLDGLHALRT